MVRSFHLTVPLICISFLLFGQPDLKLHGKIVDYKTGAPIPFATIRLLKNNQVISGVISNNNGDFQIPNKLKDSIDVIVISCIGYKTKQVSINLWYNTQVHTVRLEESITMLSQITVTDKKNKRLTPAKIVEMAIDNIPDNYDKCPNSYAAYFRDYQMRDNNYINLNEAIVEIFDQGFGNNDELTTKVKLLDYKHNQDYPRDSLTSIVYDNEKGNKFVPGATLFAFGGNDLSILRIHDAIRNYNLFSFSFTNTFNKDFVRNHFFNIEGTVFKHDIPLYHISFETKSSITGNNHFSNGHIYIERGDYAIHKLEYFTHEKKGAKAALLYKIIIEYERGSPLMRLNYISCNDRFMIKNPADFKATDVLYDQKLNAFVVKYNHTPDPNSALNKNNYSFYYNNKSLEVDRIEIQKNRENMIYAYLKDNIIPTHADPIKVGSKLNAKFKGIKDSHNREINEITYLTVNQFRELFVQKNTTSIHANDTTFINKYLPLYKNSPIKNQPVEISGYWMNSPLKKD